MPPRKPDPQPKPPAVWVVGAWPPPRQLRTGPACPLTINWDGGAVVTDCVTGRRLRVRARIQLTHLTGADGKPVILPAVRGEILSRMGSYALVKFRDGQTAQVALLREEAAA